LKKILFFIAVIFLLVGFSLKSQTDNYISYHRNFGQIEELIVKENFKEAALKIDTLFQEYEVRFVKDYVVAAQICLLNHNNKKAVDYLIRSTKNGVKIECLKSINLLQQNLNQDNWNDIEQAYKASRKAYLKRINLDLYQEFHKRYQKEQDAKGKDFYKPTVYSNFNRIKKLLDTQEFKGEKQIGIDNQRFAKSISDCSFGNSRIIVTLLHYDYPLSEIGEYRLFVAIEKGNLHPREFATIYNFEKNKQSVLYKQSKKAYPILPDYHFNLPFGEIITDLDKVNADRSKFGICKYEVDLRKEKISRKYGLQLNFGYR